MSYYPRPYLSRTVPSKTAGHKQLVNIQMQDHNVKQLERISMYAKCIGDTCRAIVRVRIPGYVLKKKEK